jgi:hypothetical protein
MTAGFATIGSPSRILKKTATVDEKQRGEVSDFDSKLDWEYNWIKCGGRPIKSS